MLAQDGHHGFCQLRQLTGGQHFLSQLHKIHAKLGPARGIGEQT